MNQQQQDDYAQGIPARGGVGLTIEWQRVLVPLLMVEGGSPAYAVVSYVNESYVRTFGHVEPGWPPPGALESQGLLSLSPHPLVRALRGEYVDAEEVQLLTADGRTRQFTCSATAIRHEGKVSGAVFCVPGGTEQKRSERRLAVQYEVARIVMECEDFFSVAPRILETIAGWNGLVKASGSSRNQARI